MIITLMIFIGMHYQEQLTCEEGFKDTKDKCDCTELENRNKDWEIRANKYSKKLNQCIASQLDLNNFMKEYIEYSQNTLGQKYNLIESEYKKQIDILTTKYNELASKINLKVDKNKEMMNNVNDGLVIEEEQANQMVTEEESDQLQSKSKKLDQNNNNKFGFPDSVGV